MENPVNSKGFIPAFLLISGAVAILVGLASFFGYREYQLKKSILGTNTTPPTVAPVTPSPTPTQTQKPKQVVVKTIDPDPFITCNINFNCGGGSRQMRKSECNQSTCCQIGDKWYFYLSKTKCDQDQNSYYSSYNHVNLNAPTYTYTPPTYYTCTLYYPALHTYQTYTSLYKTRAECDAAQANLNQSVNTIPQYTAPVYQPPQMTKNQCISSVNDKWRGQMMSYGCAYPCPETGDCGSSSVCDALWYQAQKDMGACNQYP